MLVSEIKTLGPRQTLSEFKQVIDEYRKIVSVLSKDLAFGSTDKKQYAREVVLRAFNSALTVNENYNKTARGTDPEQNNGLVTIPMDQMSNHERK